MQPPNTPQYPDDAAVLYVQQIAREAALEAYTDARVDHETILISQALNNIKRLSGLEPLTVLDTLSDSLRKPKTARSAAKTPAPGTEA